MRLRHLDELDDGATICADVAVVGAGPAGITLALALARSGRRVALLEAGGLDLEADTQDLYDGEVVGRAYEPLMSTRLRYFGGTSNHWTGWCLPLSPIDLAPRPWLDLPGWPFGHDELARWYPRAQEMLEAGAFQYDAALWARSGATLRPFDERKLRHLFWQKSPPTRFGTRYRPEIEADARIDPLLGANVIAIDAADGGGNVIGLTARSTRGRTARVTAGRYVLACGAIENARLLLANDATRPGGPGNRHDVVGRYFMEHPRWKVASLVTDDPYPLLDDHYRREVDGRLSRTAWAISDAAQLRLRCLDCFAELEIERDADHGGRAARDLAEDALALRWPDDLAARMAEVVADLRGVAVGTWRRYVDGTYVNGPVRSLDLSVSLDPLPNPSSRVTLGPARDALGMRRPVLDWRLSDEDGHSVAATARLVAGEITRLGLAQVRLHPDLTDPRQAWIHVSNLAGHDGDPARPEMEIRWHHAGTTRMGNDPRTSVVDGNGRVHGIGNLYAAGGSVFPTSGSANPTLTIVALALRLADHVAGLPG